jgi:hypothetical protein
VGRYFFTIAKSEPTSLRLLSFFFLLLSALSFFLLAYTGHSLHNSTAFISTADMAVPTISESTNTTTYKSILAIFATADLTMTNSCKEIKENS